MDRCEGCGSADGYDGCLLSHHGCAVLALLAWRDAAIPLLRQMAAADRFDARMHLTREEWEALDALLPPEAP